MEKDKANKSRYYFLLLLVLSVIGFARVTKIALSGRMSPQWLYIIFAAAPIIIFGVMYLLAVKRVVRSRFLVILATMVAVLFVIVEAFSVLIMRLNNEFEGITNVKSYEEILVLNRHSQAYLDFFPKEIPDNAVDSGIYEHPRYLKGGSKLYLYLKFNKEDYEGIVEKLWLKAETIISSDREIIKEKGVYIEEVRYMEDYFVFEDIIYKLSPDSHIGRWYYYILAYNINENDGIKKRFIAGVAANDDSNSIIYYGEQ